MINAQEIAKCYEVMEAAEGLVKKEAEEVAVLEKQRADTVAALASSDLMPLKIVTATS